MLRKQRNCIQFLSCFCFRYTALLYIQSLCVSVKFSYLYIIKSVPEHSQPLQKLPQRGQTGLVASRYFSAISRGNNFSRHMGMMQPCIPQHIYIYTYDIIGWGRWDTFSLYFPIPFGNKQRTLIEL